MYLRLFVVLVMFFVSGIKADTITVFASLHDENPTHQYYLDLLRFLLDKSSKKDTRIVTLRDGITTHQPVISLLNKKLIDLTWMGTKAQYEQQLHAIPIPLLKGLLGYRISLIDGKRREEFEKMSVDELKKRVACQGIDWLDSDVLAWNGFNVLRVERVDLIVKMLVKGHCDYFPRAIFEGYNELAVAKQKYPELAIFDQVILAYKFPLYFFVHKDNTELAMLLSSSLKLATADGSFDNFIENHPFTADIFPLTKWQNKTVLKLDNPYLPKSAPLDDKKLWVEF